LRGRRDFRFRHPAESVAWEHFREQGHLLLRHNYQIQGAEIDLITLCEETLHFIEVKAYSGGDFQAGLAFGRQIRRYKRALRHFLFEFDEAVASGADPYADLASGRTSADFSLSIDFCGLDETYKVDYYPNIASDEMA